MRLGVDFSQLLYLQGGPAFLSTPKGASTTDAVGVPLNGIGCIIWMACWAVSLSIIKSCQLAAFDVLVMSHQFQMLWSDTVSIWAKMIPLKTHGRQPNEEMMSPPISSISPKATVTLSMPRIRLPEPACFSLRNARPEAFLGGIHWVDFTIGAGHANRG